ncbi:hypothetical protein ACFLUB_03675 [Chloroflexota bacterium]
MTYFECIHEFARVGFNRKEDRKDQLHKVLAEKAPYLFGAILVRTIAEACKIRLSDWSKYRTDDIEYIMTGKDPTTRMERDYVRLKKKEVREIYEKCLKWVFRHDGKLLKGADQWYKCRVNPGTIEAYLNEAAPLSETGLERSNVQTAIAPYDEATGYPRKWRK